MTTISRDGRDYDVMLVPKGRGFMRMREAGPDDLFAALGLAREPETSAEVARLRAELACAMLLLGPALAQMDGGEDDGPQGRAAKALKSGTGAQAVLLEVRTLRALVREAMGLIGRARANRRILKADVDSLLTRMAQALGEREIVVD